jgi:hypothetical protein
LCELDFSKQRPLLLLGLFFFNDFSIFKSNFDKEEVEERELRELFKRDFSFFLKLVAHGT